MATDLTTLDGMTLHAKLAAKECSCVEIVEAYLNAITTRDGEIGSFLVTDAPGARAAATVLDEKLAAGEALPPLAGFVLAVKDNIAVKDMTATAGSKILEGYIPPYEATAVSRLRTAGAIFIGKTNLDEFGMGASTEQSGFHPTKNPHDTSRVPGGSSGGSAAAVAAGFCTAALGTDTGGSVRQPAAFCGVVGMRPTYGLVSRSGLIALASSMDTIGPLARTVADARAILSVMSGHDHADATTLPERGITSHGTVQTLKGLKIGMPKEYVDGITDRQVRSAYEAFCAHLKDLGAELVDCTLPTTPHAIPAYYVLMPAEASSNLARYDGIRFGHPGRDDLGHRQVYAHLRGERFGLEPQRRITVGTFTLSAGYADRYYHAAQCVRTLIREDFERVFDDVDFLVTPATPTVAFPLGSITDPVDMYRQDMFMSAVSLAGFPALSLPAPDAGTLPVGIQLIAPQGADAALLDVAEASLAR